MKVIGSTGFPACAVCNFSRQGFAPNMVPELSLETKKGARAGAPYMVGLISRGKGYNTRSAGPTAPKTQISPLRQEAVQVLEAFSGLFKGQVDQVGVR